ncbi:2590_t:CDS:2 [Ambispora leptoticha]|uniref:2590_t:CDS:1 n=1 Tax=Ambispora leptoticha TaxID=144679 RepID=A0A9N9FR91_9GLOM|nr:2590_t:CDS:2 [Ambispora leptoticha]
MWPFEVNKSALMRGRLAICHMSSHSKSKGKSALVCGGLAICHMSSLDSRLPEDNCRNSFIGVIC